MMDVAKLIHFLLMTGTVSGSGKNEEKEEDCDIADGRGGSADTHLHRMPSVLVPAIPLHIYKDVKGYGHSDHLGTRNRAP